LGEIKANQNEIADIIKYHKFDVNTDDIPSIQQIGETIKTNVEGLEQTVKETKSLLEDTIPSINEKLDDLITNNEDGKILKKIDTMEQIMIKKNEETLNKITELERQVQVMSQNQEERQQTPMRRSNSFDEVKELMKPDNKTKRKRKNPKSRRPALKDTDSLKMKIAKAAKCCKNNNDLKTMLELLRNEDKNLTFGKPNISLNADKDPLDQMIEQNCFPPIDQWRCPICHEEIDTIEEDEQSQWENHLCLKHNLSKYNFNNIFPFFIYGHFYLQLCYFEKEQDD
jgi:hypothetical protein